MVRCRADWCGVQVIGVVLIGVVCIEKARVKMVRVKNSVFVAVSSHLLARLGVVFAVLVAGLIFEAVGALRSVGGPAGCGVLLRGGGRRCFVGFPYGTEWPICRSAHRDGSGAGLVLRGCGHALEESRRVRLAHRRRLAACSRWSLCCGFLLAGGVRLCGEFVVSHSYVYASRSSTGGYVPSRSRCRPRWWPHAVCRPSSCGPACCSSLSVSICLRSPVAAPLAPCRRAAFPLPLP